MSTKPQDKKPRRPFVPYPASERGKKWMSEMIKASEESDKGKKKNWTDVVDEMQTPLLKREREPGEDDL